jgi:hypothetical protein
VIDRLAAEYRAEGSFARAAEVRRALTDAEMSRRLASDLRGYHLTLCRRGVAMMTTSRWSPIQACSRVR